MKEIRLLLMLIIALMGPLAAIFQPELIAGPAVMPVIQGAALKGPAYNPSDSTEKVVDEAMKRANAPMIRCGFGILEMINIMDEDLNYYYNKAWALMADWFFLRERNSSGNGFDLYTRFTYRNFSVGRDILEMESDLRYDKNTVHIVSLDVGIRGVVGAYFLRQLWQFYILAAPRVLYYGAVMKESRYGDGDKRVNLASGGFIGGAGIEVTLVPAAGIFAEYNIGYTPVGRTYRNVEGHQVYVGMTWRTVGR